MTPGNSENAFFPWPLKALRKWKGEIFPILSLPTCFYQANFFDGSMLSNIGFSKTLGLKSEQ